MQRDQPLLGSQPKSDSSNVSSPSFFGFRQNGHIQQPRESHVGDLEMNVGGNSEPRGSAFETIGKYFGSESAVPKNASAKERKIPTKVEPKVFFSNERTFLSWMNMAVTLSTISLAVVA